MALRNAGVPPESDGGAARRSRDWEGLCGVRNLSDYSVMRKRGRWERRALELPILEEEIFRVGAGNYTFSSI